MRRRDPVRLRPREARRHRRVRGGSGTVAKRDPAASARPNSTFVLCTDRRGPPIPSTGAGLTTRAGPGGRATATRSPRERGGAVGERPPPFRGTVGASRGTQARNVADPAPAHGRSALPSVTSLPRAARDGLRLRPQGRLHAEGCGPAEARCRAEGGRRPAPRRGAEGPAEEEAGASQAGYRVRVTFESPRGRSTSRPSRRASESATSCAETAKLIGVD